MGNGKYITESGKYITAKGKDAEHQDEDGNGNGNGNGNGDEDGHENGDGEEDGGGDEDKKSVKLSTCKSLYEYLYESHIKTINCTSSFEGLYLFSTSQEILSQPNMT